MAIDQINHPINPPRWPQPRPPASSCRDLIHAPMTPASRAPDLVPREGQGSLGEQNREARWRPSPKAGGKGGFPKTDVSPALAAHSQCADGLFTWHLHTPFPQCLDGQITACRSLSSSQGEPRGEAPAFTRKPAHAQIAPFTWGTCPGPIPMLAAKRASLNGCLLGSRCRFWDLLPILPLFSLV